MGIFEPVITTSKQIGVIEICDHDISVPTDFHDEHDLLHDLFESILCVEGKYLLYKDKATGKEQKHLERVFAYELYRQWANRIQIKWGDKLVINGEIGKEPQTFDHYRSKVHKFPDLVLHSSQGDCDFQGVVCEIKTSHVTPSSFKEDIDKLNCFVCCENEKYRFMFGVFILIGDDMDKILEMMDGMEGDVFKATPTKYIDRIICVTYNHYHLNAVRFDWLIRKEDREQLRKSIKK